MISLDYALCGAEVLVLATCDVSGSFATPESIIDVGALLKEIMRAFGCCCEGFELCVRD